MASTSQQFDTLDGLVVTGDMSVGANLNVDLGTLFVDASTNRVGIGKTNPQYNLDIPGNAFINTLTANNFNYVSITSINVDDLTLSGNSVQSATELNLNSTGPLIANTSTGQITLRDNGTTYGAFVETSGHLDIRAGSSATQALQLQSDGDVVFAANVAISDGKKIDFGSVMDITASATGATFSANTYHVGKIVHSGDTDTYLDFNAVDQFQLTCGGSTVLSANSTTVSTKILNVEDYFKETVYSGTIAGNAYTINPLLGSVHTITATGNFSVDVDNIPTSGAITLTLIVTNSGGTWEIEWPGSGEPDAIYWAEGTEPPSSSGIDIYTFYCVNGTIYGGLALRKAGWAQ